ncbi:MAG: phosphoribosylamine--glycine ligase [Bacteroidales bacterium]|nr:phosphoribosylamine--glycine ligase [Bacteroidales bacterium]
MNILLLGSGGREHAIAYKLTQSAHCEHLYIAPGNAGTAAHGTNVALDINNFSAIGEFAINNNIAMMVVGPEAPLVGGITDFFRNSPTLRNIMVLGPDREGAQLEGSKAYAKQFMQQYGIPTARYRSFTADTLEQGYAFLDTLTPPYVLKADGLAAGKGVLIINDLDEAKSELRNMLVDAKFGNASSKVVIEEYLTGIEMSAFAITDGKSYKMLPEAKDYKRIFDGDKGPNTGGMGSVSPVCFADQTFKDKVEQRIVQPTIRGLQERGIDYHGFIFFGLMAVPDHETGQYDPYVIEYNVRMGDPETESVFPRLLSDVAELLRAACTGELDKQQLLIDPHTAACVMMVAGGYPDHYDKGDIIYGIENVSNSLIFHAGTKRDGQGHYVTNGGRVICVTSLAPSLPEALLESYQSAAHIQWRGKFQRRDIGQDLLRLMVQ